MIVLALVVAMTGGAAVVFRGDGERGRPAVAVEGDASGPGLRTAIGRLQDRLREQPKDDRAWAALGVGYVEEARQTGDPTLYARAEEALDRSLALKGDNAGAFAGRAALAAARHDFGGALRSADQALAINPYEARGLAVRVDALVELGRLDDAWKAVQEADSRKPGIPIFTRYAYVLELRGKPAKAREVLGRALESATDPADLSFVRYQLGDLALNTGRPRDALTLFGDALRDDPQNLAALDGRARARQATGDVGGALADREALAGRAPLPGYVTALGELYDARGLPDKARAQYGIVRTWSALARANGVDPDLELALFEADHGDPATALRTARAEWRARCGPPPPAGRIPVCSLHVSDALGWALHATGDDREALRYARAATATGYHPPSFTHHLETIKAALK
ncbi:tetratricopeptide repeat protein [Actinocorallia longicatena]|uniref:Tetratricopeptide repeat protein n=2 Tax=Actinocorallia longicatena TaxID=111803 RepID=A0ABP6QG32_9ACTN